MSHYRIEPMTTDADMDGKGYVHWKSWQETYTGLLDADFLNKRSLEACRSMAKRWPDNTLIAKTDQGSVVGFACHGRNQDDDLTDCGEVYALYVLKDYQRQGVGRALMEAALKQMPQYQRIAVWVLRENKQAIDFYTWYGFVRDGAEKEIQLGNTRIEVRLILDIQSPDI